MYTIGGRLYFVLRTRDTLVLRTSLVLRLYFVLRYCYKTNPFIESVIPGLIRDLNRGAPILCTSLFLDFGEGAVDYPSSIVMVTCCVSLVTAPVTDESVRMTVSLLSDSRSEMPVIVTVPVV